MKNLKAWLYYRLSRDEDQEMNSLQNQRQILVDYANQNGHDIVGESFDDNVSGMTFNRKGLGELENAVDEKKIEIVLVKDLSRLGRHRTQTDLFIDHLRQNKVKVISVTEGIDSSNENDDLLIGFKQIFNDFYAKDISRKVKAGIRQKQKSSGVIESLPIGYVADRINKRILVDPEAAAIVRDVFDMFLEGYGISLKLAVRIYKAYGEDLYKILKENPYQLAEDIDGVGFLTADRIAARAGIAADSEMRLKCGILYVLSASQGEGNVYLPLEMLVSRSSAMLQADPEAVRPALSALISEHKLISRESDDGTIIYSGRLYYLELNSARMLLDLSVPTGTDREEVMEELIKFQQRVKEHPEEFQLK